MLNLISCNVQTKLVKFDSYNCIRVVKGPQKLNKYESPADITLNKWIDLTAEVHDERAKFYVNSQLVLTVDKLIHGDSRGRVGLFVDIGTEGFFRDLKIIKNSQ